MNNNIRHLVALVAQLVAVACLSADTCLTADTGVASSIPAGSRRLIMKLDKCIVLRIGTLTGCPLCRESHPLCRLKNPTVI